MESLEALKTRLPRRKRLVIQTYSQSALADSLVAAAEKSEVSGRICGQTLSVVTVSSGR